jgi:hypothetical protein
MNPTVTQEEEEAGTTKEDILLIAPWFQAAVWGETTFVVNNNVTELPKDSIRSCMPFLFSFQPNSFTPLLFLSSGSSCPIAKFAPVSSAVSERSFQEQEQEQGRELKENKETDSDWGLTLQRGSTPPQT